MTRRAVWGWVAEFTDGEALLDATRRASSAGCRPLEAYSPFPLEGLAEALGAGRSRVPAFTLAGALLGASGGYLMQWYAAVVDRPLNIGGRPLHSWPMFVPVAFEMAVLFGVLFALGAMLWSSGLPALYHPLFGSPGFDLATRNRFFLCVRAGQRGWNAAAVTRLFDELHPLSWAEVRA